MRVRTVVAAVLLAVLVGATGATAKGPTQTWSLAYYYANDDVYDKAMLRVIVTGSGRAPLTGLLAWCEETGPSRTYGTNIFEGTRVPATAMVGVFVTLYASCHAFVYGLPRNIEDWPVSAEDFEEARLSPVLDFMPMA